MGDVINMEPQTMPSNQNAEPKPSRLKTIFLPALFRLALLVVPMTLSVIVFERSPLLCVIACVGVLIVWLTVDTGPFRASAPAPKPAGGAEVSIPRRLAKAQSWSSLFCQIVVTVALLHSKLSI